MKTFLLVAALAIPVPCQMLSVEPVCLTICTAAGADNTGPMPVANYVSFCGSPTTDIGIMAVSLGSMPCAPLVGGMLIDPSQIVFLAPMQVNGTTHTFSMAVPQSLAPVVWTQQAFYFSTWSGAVWTLPEAWRFTLQ